MFGSDRIAFWLSVVYAFGTPVFYRTGYINHNLMLGHFVFWGFVALWNPGGSTRLSLTTRHYLAGLAGGAALLYDYSGVIFLLGLFGYVLLKAWQDYRPRTIALASWYVAGTLIPVFLLFWYQYRSFGHPFYPGQHWMPPVAWIDVGYQGFSLPQPDILRSLLADYRYGLFTSCPIFLFALAAFLLNRRNGGGRFLPPRELAVTLGLVAALYLFCSGISYTRLQFNSGIRYMAPSFPFLFLAASIGLRRLPPKALYFVAVAAIGQAWCMAMYRDVERGAGVFEPILRVFTGGFQLPVLTVASRMEYLREYFAVGVSPLPLFAVMAAILVGIWSQWPNKEEHGSSGTLFR
jgi:hypothetical protein